MIQRVKIMLQIVYIFFSFICILLKTVHICLQNISLEDPRSDTVAQIERLDLFSKEVIVLSSSLIPESYVPS